MAMKTISPYYHKYLVNAMAGSLAYTCQVCRLRVGVDGRRRTFDYFTINDNNRF
jgi:hypothetical protein